MITFKVSGKQFRINKTILKQQMKSSDQNQLEKKQIIQLPSWVEEQYFQFILNYLKIIQQTYNTNDKNSLIIIKNYLKKQILHNPKQTSNQTKKLIQIMRVSDYLTLQKFQQYFIQYCVIDYLNHKNCIIYLQETHKKLKNTTSGAAQAWYNLLNACIDYISHHLSEIYLNETERIEKLHQKILGQILDRTLKYCVTQNNQMNYQSKQKQIIFNLLMKSKKANSIDNLCSILKTNLLNKKINKKMHAKLSWKLHDLNQIKDKKIKNFKFFDLNWMLQATRIKNSSNKKIEVNLTLLPVNQIDIKTTFSQYQIGIFYIKLYWNLQESSLQNSAQKQFSLQKQGQNQLQIHYLCLKNPLPLKIFQISPQFEQKINNKKLQLSIYCSVDHCYSFVLNYILEGYNRLRIDEKKLSISQIYALIQGSKSSGKYSQAVWLIKYLNNNQIEIPKYILQNLPFDKIPTYEAEFLKKITKTPNFNTFETLYKKSSNQKLINGQNQINSLSSSKISDINQTRSNKSVNPSKGRHKKIFLQSPHKIGTSQVIISNSLHKISNNFNQQYGSNQRQQIMKIIGLQNYFYDKNSLILNQI